MGGLEVTGEEDGKSGDLAHILLLQDLPRAWEMLLLSKEGKGARWLLPHSKKGSFSQILQQHLSPSSKYKSFLHMKLILLSNRACFIACGWILMNSSTLSLHKQQFLVRRAQLLLSPLILNMCRLEPSKDLGMPRTSDA